MDMNTSLWLAVFSIILTVLFGTFSIIVSLVVAVWKVGLRFTTIEKEMAGYRSEIGGFNRRLDRIESKIDSPNNKTV